MILDIVASVLKEGERFFLGSHKDPDGDALGSLLALGEALRLSGKEAVLFNEGPIPDTLTLLPGIERITDTFHPRSRFDAIFVLDCANLERIGRISLDLAHRSPLINIDHHENNSQFGDLNLVDGNSSSVGEIIYRLIKVAALPMNRTIAENIFVAIQTDTGSFRYDNTTSAAFAIAREMFDWGINPWMLSRKVMYSYTLKKLKLLAAALKTIELYHKGEVGLITITKEMLFEAGVDDFDSERFVDYPRYIAGVEVAALIREIEQDHYKFSLRSNDSVNVADLASRFGGGGHPRAAAFTRVGSLELVKKEFINKAIEFLGKLNS